MQTSINWPGIECEACGNCCPDRCSHKTKGGLCEVHPEIIGEEAALRIRGMCDGGVLVQFANHVYCPPVMQIVEAHSNVKAVSCPREDGTVWVDNFKEVDGVLRKLRGLD